MGQVVVSNPTDKKTTSDFFYFLFSFSRFKHCRVVIQNRALSHTFIFTPRIHTDLNRSRDKTLGKGVEFSLCGRSRAARPLCGYPLESPPRGCGGPSAAGLSVRPACAGSGVSPRAPGAGGGAVTATPSDIMSAAARQTCPSPLPLQPYGAVNSRAGTGFCCCL